jgi:predicted glycosyltransferase
MKLLLVVTHLLGSGHLSRALTLGRAFAAAGHDVCVASGGMPVPQLDHTNVTFVQLPPLRSDGVNFTRLLDSDGHVATQSYLDERQTLLNDTLSQLRPDVLITELFPFGRRSLKHEFQGLLQQAKDLTTPLVLGSIRDILAPPSKPAKADFAVDMVTRFYDAVMVHSDANITPLSLSWPVGPELEPFLHYTGFVAPPKPQPHPNEAGKGEVIVSAGGGDVGTRLFEAAIGAAQLDKNLNWRILVGGSNATAQIEQLGSNRPANVIVEPASPDFREMLNHATISVSMCGYNTALDVLQTGVPAVFIPFDAGGEVEQSIRANALSKQSNISVLVDAKLAPETLLLQVQSGLKHPRNTGRSAGFDGAAHTVSIIENLLCERTKQ